MRGITHLCFKWDDAPFLGIKVGHRNQLCLFLPTRSKLAIQRNWSWKVHFRNTNYITFQCSCKNLNVAYETLIRENVWSGKLCSSMNILWFAVCKVGAHSLVHIAILNEGTNCPTFVLRFLSISTCAPNMYVLLPPLFSKRVEKRKRVTTRTINGLCLMIRYIFKSFMAFFAVVILLYLYYELFV